nr:MAG TPA: hypothetical protein [Caudoviricetes sp.]
MLILEFLLTIFVSSIKTDIIQIIFGISQCLFSIIDLILISCINITKITFTITL